MYLLLGIKENKNIKTHLYHLLELLLEEGITTIYVVMNVIDGLMNNV
jgi:hypothetical protein